MREIFFLLTLLICATGLGQELAPIEWHDLEPVKNYSHENWVVEDVEKYMPEGHIYRDGDIVTWVHETTHGINSRIRQKHQGYNGFYILGGKYALFKSPNIRKSDVIPYIDNKYKDISIYSLYISGQTEWDDTPLYIMDEWVAYTNGSLVGTRRDTVKFMLYFNFYVGGMMEAIKEKDPSYPEYEQLRSFVIGNMFRTFHIAKTEEEMQLVRELCQKYFPTITPP